MPLWSSAFWHSLSGLAAHLCLTLLTFLPASQQGELTAAPPQSRSEFPNAASHTPQSMWRAAPRGGRKSRQTPGRCPLPASLVYTFQICTWLHVTARWHHSDPQHSPACTRAEAFLSSQLLALSMTFFHVHRTDTTKVIQTFWSEKHKWDEITYNHKGVFQVLRTSQSVFLLLQLI